MLIFKSDIILSCVIDFSGVGVGILIVGAGEGDSNSLPELSIIETGSSVSKPKMLLTTFLTNSCYDKVRTSIRR